MNSGKIVDNLLVSSIDIINKTSISRATLNNYIKMNLIPNPIVKKPASISTQARRLGYFPANVISTIEQIKKMKINGYPMEYIIRQLAKVDNDSSAMDYVNQEKPRLETPEKDENTISQGVTVNQHSFGRPALDILNQHQPTPVTFSVMVARFQNSDQIFDELLPEEYFELLNQVWSLAGESIIKYHGNNSRYVGNEVQYYFHKDKDNQYILDSVSCALEIRVKMKNVSGEWALRKNWLHEVSLNIGINEGQEYCGIISSVPGLEIMIPGDTVEQATGLSAFACHGAIWTTKSLISKLTSEERKNLHYGIRRGDKESEIFMKNVFSRMMDIMGWEDAANDRLQSLARLPITEILDHC